MGKNLQIDEEYLDELIGEVSRRVVGKVMKRCEIFEVDKNFKAELKELIYEGFREFDNLLYAHSKGINISVWKIKGTDSTPIKE